VTRFTVLGGATRILIIDDDPRANLPQPAVDDDRAAEPGAQWPLEDQATGADEVQPTVHEYQIPTPLPGDVGVARSEVLLDPGVGCRPDPSTVRELIVRVEELLHRTRSLPATTTPGWAGTIQFGSVLLEPATQTVLRAGQPVRVTHTEFRLLLALIRRRGAIASRLELLREIWGAGAAVSRRAVDTHIARLRRKLEEDPANPRHILTALAWGYRFRP
jgi:hypothetical protein